MAFSRPAADPRPPAPWAELAELLGDLPTPSPLASGFLVGRGDSLPEAPTAVARIAAHPDVTERLLALLNARPFRREAAVHDLAEARNVHGERTLCTLSAALLLPGLSPSAATSPAFADQDWLARNAVVAAAARKLAGRCRAWLADEAFLTAALARVGVPTLRAVLPSSERAPEGLRRRALLAWELEHLGLHHACLGAALLETWDLPALIVEAVRLLGPNETPAGHERSAAYRAGAQVLAALVDAADAAADVIADRDPESARDDLEEFAETTGLSAATLETLLTELEPDATELRAILAS